MSDMPDVASGDGEGMKKDRPILFSAPMVRAILEGRKTQTRRVITSARGAKSLYAGERDGLWVVERFGDPGQALVKSPYGVPGGRLWVREGWRPEIAHSHGMNACDCGDVNITYRAGGACRFVCDRLIPEDWTMPKAAKKGDVTSLFMPKWASRLTLEVVSVRVERVQEVSAADAQAEGCESCTPYDQYRALWNHINGKREGCAWSDNPWVWAVEFRRAEA